MTLSLAFPFRFHKVVACSTTRFPCPLLQAIPRPFEAIAGLVPFSGTKTRGPPLDQHIPAISHPGSKYLGVLSLFVLNRRHTNRSGHRSTSSYPRLLHFVSGMASCPP